MILAPWYVVRECEGSPLAISLHSVSLPWPWAWWSARFPFTTMSPGSSWPLELQPWFAWDSPSSHSKPKSTSQVGSFDSCQPLSNWHCQDQNTHNKWFPLIQVGACTFSLGAGYCSSSGSLPSYSPWMATQYYTPFTADSWLCSSACSSSMTPNRYLSRVIILSTKKGFSASIDSHAYLFCALSFVSALDDFQD